MQNKNLLLDISKILITGIITWGLTYMTFRKNYDAAEVGRLNDNLNQILKIDLEYPIVEDSVFICRWSKEQNSNDKEHLQYRAYCIYVFNFLQNVCEYYNYNKESIEKFVDIKELAIEHKVWLQASYKEDANGYPKIFIDFIESYQK